MIGLFQQLRAHRSFATHGPEHHAAVPAIIVTTYGNLTGQRSVDNLKAAITRGAKVPGGFCGFAGGCGAALGVGIGFGIIIGANPRKATERQLVQQATGAVIAELASIEAARCCQRDGYLALRKAAELSKPLVGVQLIADGVIKCQQHEGNKVCFDQGCPLFP